MTNYSQQIPNEFVGKLIDAGFTELDSKSGYTWIPTYGEVFDWFSHNKGIVITLEPFYTFSLKGQIGYTWKINYIDPDLGLVLRTEEDEYKSGDGFGGSFQLTANAAIESALRIK